MPVLGYNPSPGAMGGAVVRDGGPLIGQEYFRIKDQAGRIWYWWISYDLAPDWNVAPGVNDQEVRLYTIPSWLKLRDSQGVLWYLYPSLDGAPTVDPNPPPLGIEVTNSPLLRVRGGSTRYIYFIAPGGGLDVAPT